MSEREVLLEKVSDALPVFEQINELYFSANSLNQQVMVWQADELRLSENSRTTVKKFLWGAWLGILLGDILLYLIPPALRTIFFFPMLIGSPLAGGYLYNRLKKAKNQAQISDLEQQIASIAPQIDQISQEVYRIFIENQAVIEPIPRDYRYYDAVAYFEKVLANGQADTMKEAISLFEEALHRQALELNSRLALEQSRAQSAMMANIERSSQQAAASADTAAVFSILNYLKVDK